MRKQARTGFSLVEVLVSLLILSVGVIGAASMLLSALRNTQQSGYHGIALQLAADAADQIRGYAISDVNDAGNPYLALDFRNGDIFQRPEDLCLDVSSSCELAAMADSGIYEIQTRLIHLLPQGRIKVCRDAMPWNDSSNSYTWNCNSLGGTAPIVVKLGWREMLESSSGSITVMNPRLVMLVQS